MSTPAPGWGPPPSYDPSGPAPSGVSPRTSTKAIVALVLAIAAYTPAVPFVGAVAALFVARSARRDIEAGRGAQTGLGLCTAAVVIAWVHLALVALLAAFVVFLLVLGLGFGFG